MKKFEEREKYCLKPLVMIIETFIILVCIHNEPFSVQAQITNNPAYCLGGVNCQTVSAKTPKGASGSAPLKQPAQPKGGKTNPLNPAPVNPNPVNPAPGGKANPNPANPAPGGKAKKQHKPHKRHKKHQRKKHTKK